MKALVQGRAPLEAARQVGGTLTPLFDQVDAWQRQLQQRLDEVSASAGVLDAEVADFALPALSEPSGLASGIGFVGAPGLLVGEGWHVAWWWLAGQAKEPRRLSTATPGGDQLRDYSAMEWWRVPSRTAARHLSGPYVDYVCVNDYVLTITAPVLRAGTVVGVVGADLLVDRLERQLLPLLTPISAPCTLVNSSARVVTSTDARREPGSVLRSDALAEALLLMRQDASAPLDVEFEEGARVLSCGSSSLALVIGR